MVWHTRTFTLRFDCSYESAKEIHNGTEDQLLEETLAAFKELDLYYSDPSSPGVEFSLNTGIPFGDIDIFVEKMESVAMPQIVIDQIQFAHNEAYDYFETL